MVFLPRESHGQRSLAGHSPLGHRKSDMTKQLILFHQSLVDGPKVMERPKVTPGTPPQTKCRVVSGKVQTNL